MKIIFDKKTKDALEELIKNSCESYIRIKAFLGCGKPAYELYVDFKSDEDLIEVIQDVPFIIKKDNEKICDGIEIKYDKDIYNNGFYVKSI